MDKEIVLNALGPFLKDKSSRKFLVVLLSVYGVWTVSTNEISIDPLYIKSLCVIIISYLFIQGTLDAITGIRPPNIEDGASKDASSDDRTEDAVSEDTTTLD